MKNVFAFLIVYFVLFAFWQAEGATSDVFAGIDPVFELVDGQNQRVNEKQFRGKYVLLGFGFTHCAHICPVLAANMAKALKKTDSDSVGIFISVDTERDTPAITHAYAAGFGKNMVGLSGSYSQVTEAAANFNVSFVVTKSQNNYSVQHTSSIFLIDPEGRLVDVFPFNASPAAMSALMEWK